MKSSTISRLVITAVGCAVAVAFATPGAGHAEPGNVGEEARRVGAAVADATEALGAQANVVVDVDGLAADTAGVQVDIPHNSQQPVTMTSAEATLQIQLPVQESAAEAVLTDEGTVVYPDVRAPADVAVQALADGTARALVTVQGPQAANEYAFDLTLPEDTYLVPVGDGSIDMVRGTGTLAELVGTVAAPWATDAEGNPVPTSYRVEGDTIVQVIEHHSSTAYPVVADPTWGWSWSPPGPVAYLNRSETRTVANSPLIELAVIFTAFLGPQWSVLAAAQAAVLRDWARRAIEDNRCLRITFSGLAFGGTYSGGNCR